MSARLLDSFDVTSVPLSPQRGEGAGVRGEKVNVLSTVDGRAAHSPLTLTLSPLRGERIGFVRLLKLGCVSTHCEPAVSKQEILQARALSPPVS